MNKHSLYFSLPTFLAYILTLFICTALIYFGLVLTHWKKNVVENIPVNIVFKEEATPSEIKGFMKDLSKNLTIKRIDSLSPAMATDLIEGNLSKKGNHNIDEILGYNPFPFVLQVFMKASEDSLSAQKLINKIQDNPLIAEINTFKKSNNNEIFSIIAKLLNVGFVVGGILFFISIILLINYIKISILRRKASYLMLKRQKKTFTFIIKPLITKILIFLVGGFSISIICFGLFMQYLHNTSLEALGYLFDIKIMAQVVLIVFISNFLIGSLVSYFLMKGMLLPVSRKKL